MGSKSVHASSREAWKLAERQHGVLTRKQLLALGMHSQAIQHRVARGRLHSTQWRGVYALGRPQLSRHGVWMAAVLGAGPGAVLSHRTAAQLWEIGATQPGEIEISVPISRRPRLRGVVVHRRTRLAADDTTTRHRVPVTSPTRTLIDLATCVTPEALEVAVNDADKLNLVRADALRAALYLYRGEPGAAVLRDLLDRHTFVLTDSQLERRFLRIVRRAGLPKPLTQHRLDGFRVDFYWPELELVVETDGLRYHRTAAQQTADRRRDQAHIAAGRTALRFSHAQIAFGPREVESTLMRVVNRLSRATATLFDPVGSQRRPITDQAHSSGTSAPSGEKGHL